jgi:hypothetical protein
MERQLWKRIVKLIEDIYKVCGKRGFSYSDAVILKTWFWAVLHDRPVAWACDESNWPIWERSWQKPSAPTMSRRLRTMAVQCLLQQLEKLVLDSDLSENLIWSVDGKPLPVSNHSQDRQARYGRAVGGKSRGYKIHAIVGQNGAIAHWRLAPMNKDERVMAGRMLKETKIRGYLLADSNYDSNKLHQVCDDLGSLQLVSPRRYGPGRGFGHRKQTAGRLRSVEILEHHSADFGRDLFKLRKSIERYFGNLTNWSASLTHLPPWVRTYRRVKRWVQAKIIANAIKRKPKQT